MNIFCSVAKEYEGKPIKCIVAPERIYGSAVEIEQIVNPGCKFSQYKLFPSKVLCRFYKGALYICSNTNR